MAIKKLYIENIRSMFGRHYIPLRQLTVLVGENSSGKTSMLASLAAILGITGNIISPDFNKEPFQLGSFEDIASYISKRTGRSKSFSLGILYDENKGFIAEYKNHSSQPLISKIIVFENSLWAFAREKSTDEWEISILRNQSENVTFENIFELESNFNDWEPIKLPSELTASTPPLLFFSKIFEKINKFLLLVLDKFPAYHIGPIRSKPRRTYEDWMKTEEPTPFILKRILIEANERIVDKLKEFGNESGLFKEVRIKKFGGSRFAITIKQTGPEHNLVDVGYGVSQVLPIIVNVLAYPGKSIITMQQPEVHLHPRAQATLASFLIEVVKNTDKQIIVETHSDYFFNRISQSIRNNSELLDKIQLLYFEKKTTKTKIYPIEFDLFGNIKDAPPSYREFFLEEELKLLGVN